LGQANFWGLTPFPKGRCQTKNADSCKMRPKNSAKIRKKRLFLTKIKKSAHFFIIFWWYLRKMIEIYLLATLPIAERN